MGARGYLESYPAFWLFRDARMLRIGEGPTEALRMHLGALHSTDAASVYDFLSGPMASADVAQELEAACRQIPGRVRSKRSIRRVLAALVTLCCSVPRREVIRRGTMRERTRALAQILDRPTMPATSVDLLTRIDPYARSIGALSAISAPLGDRDPIFSSDPDRRVDLSSVDARDLAQIEAWESGPEPARPMDRWDGSSSKSSRDNPTSSLCSPMENISRMASCGGVPKGSQGRFNYAA